MLLYLENKVKQHSELLEINQISYISRNSIILRYSIVSAWYNLSKWKRHGSFSLPI